MEEESNYDYKSHIDNIKNIISSSVNPRQEIMEYIMLRREQMIKSSQDYQYNKFIRQVECLSNTNGGILEESDFDRLYN